MYYQFVKFKKSVTITRRFFEETQILFAFFLIGNIISLAKMVKTSSTIVRRSVNLILNINLLLTQYDRYVFPQKISDGLQSSLRLNVPILLLTRCITATASREMFKCYPDQIGVMRGEARGSHAIVSHVTIQIIIITLADQH